MRLYPAIRSQMGDWKYYIVRMKMREVAQDIRLAHDIYEETTLSSAIQRILNSRRVKKQIAGFLSRRPDRFFSSIVVAAVEGEPSWHPVEMDTSVVPKVFAGSRSLRDSFGILSFGDEPKYYALDGQHRVSAIKAILDGSTEFREPHGFDDDTLSVIVVLREEHDVPDGEWLRRYRRLFSSLNRYAKPTDKDTNIIMDEDDLFAILTRRLVTDHEFFKSACKERDSHRVGTKGKNIKATDPYFTTLQVLYWMNEKLLRTRARGQLGWNEEGYELDTQIRPEEDEIDAHYDELTSYWDAILDALPGMRKDPLRMRRHAPDTTDEEPTADILYFWPIGQEMLAELIRVMLDDAFPETGWDTREVMAEALRPLSAVPWDLHDPPWRHLLLVPGKQANGASWRMRSEDRKPAGDVGLRLLRWFVGIDGLDADSVNGLRSAWEAYLYPQEQDREEVDRMWDAIEGVREAIVGGKTDDRAA